MESNTCQCYFGYTCCKCEKGLDKFKAAEILRALVGKKIIRTKPNRRGDRSYTTEPVKLIHVQDSNMVIKTSHGFWIPDDAFLEDGWTEYKTRR